MAVGRGGNEYGLNDGRMAGMCVVVSESLPDPQ